MQGMPTGVFWLLLWCLVVEASIARLTGSEIHIQGYAMTFFLWWENSQSVKAHAMGLSYYVQRHGMKRLGCR
jgi:hypothetical protein